MTTAPQQQPAPPADLQALLLVQAATLLTLEAGSAYAATSGLRAVLAAFTRAANGRWLLAGAHPAAAAPLPPAARGPIIAQLQDELAHIAAATDQLGPILAREAEHALTIGARLGAEQISLPAAPAMVILDPIAHALVEATPQTARAHLDAAVRMLDRAGTGADLQAAIAEANRATTAVDTGSRYLTNHTANDAIRQVAAAIGEHLMWVAERDACLICLALSGHVIDPRSGEGFDEFATYAVGHAPDIWPQGMPLMRPPRHPRCRCQACIWLGSMAGQPDWPMALKREAARSVLKGWSATDSRPARLKAAEKLLARGGAGLPKSVREESALAVARGEFTTHGVPVWHAGQPRRAA